MKYTDGNATSLRSLKSRTVMVAVSSLSRKKLGSKTEKISSVADSEGAFRRRIPKEGHDVLIQSMRLIKTAGRSRL